MVFLCDFLLLFFNFFSHIGQEMFGKNGDISKVTKSLPNNEFSLMKILSYILSTLEIMADLRRSSSARKEKLMWASVQF